jgi:hypothetical protein
MALATGALLGAAGAVALLGFDQPDPVNPYQPDLQSPARFHTNQPTTDRVDQPGQYNIPLRGEKLSRDVVDKLINTWASDNKKAALDIISKYGQPDGATYDMLVWHDPGQWKKLVVMNSDVQHNFPLSHKDCVLGFLDLKVPVDKIDDLARFDGSIFCMRTAGEIAAFCDREETDILSLNLAHEIIDGSKTVDQARDALTKAAMALQQGTKDPLTQDFKFTVPSGNQGDPDHPGR